MTEPTPDPTKTACLEAIDETDLPTQSACSQTPTWLPRTDGDPWGAQGDRVATRSRPQAGFGLTRRSAAQTDRSGGLSGLNRLRSRPEYLAIAKGARVARPAFVLQANRGRPGASARFGFTVSRRVGNSVIRNRVRRRLKELVRRDGGGATGVDYVLVGRAAATNSPFAEMANQLASAMRQIGKMKQLTGAVPASKGEAA